MAFRDFKSIADVQQVYHIVYHEEDFLELDDYAPSPDLLQELEFNREYLDVFTSEASRCENIIYPILRAVYKSFVEQYVLWSHKSLSYDQKLHGTPDYLITTRSELGKTVLGFPLVVVVEAKQNNFTEGWGQCLAELVAAQKLNKDELRTVYGLVTDAEVWQYGKLEASRFTKHRTHITIDNVPHICQSLLYCLKQSDNKESCIKT